ncbi:uncharacterized protein A1O9_09828 [Exophiala aquamarina CBS 119918]|uniref:3-hydroxyisobutyrate dehydrogenase n=1 Tax=Exophiala aquamarina CBS 119918 TaxID=1182545 RepID=A0A072P432_9EURO|nr:uncharacterized protein A1O9_09828 [Exophiala aquamarina CBS 119918]KEF54033.1 hypothetical protein A1O9_09828 [Exophiala aquamarina CBS 119918]
MALDLGFIVLIIFGPGIGNMGFHMAGNVRRKMSSSATLHIFDVNIEACRRFQSTFERHGHIDIARSSKDVAEQSAILISMVPMDQHAQSVYLDPDVGVIAASKRPDRLILECSTINITTAQGIGQRIMNADVGQYIDSPVSGGVRGAEAGTLSFFLGHIAGTDSITQNARETVSWMGSADRINFCGRLGDGLVCKIVNNYIGLTNLVVAAEGLAFGLKHGVEKHTLYKCIKGSSGDSWALNFANPVPGIVPESASSHGFKAGFTSKLCAKDIKLGIKAAQQVGLDPKMGEVSVKYYERADEDPRTAVSLSRHMLLTRKNITKLTMGCARVLTALLYGYISMTTH